jgi:hypothetical protein
MENQRGTVPRRFPYADGCCSPTHYRIVGDVAMVVRRYERMSPALLAINERGYLGTNDPQFAGRPFVIFRRKKHYCIAEVQIGRRLQRDNPRSYR